MNASSSSPGQGPGANRRKLLALLLATLILVVDQFSKAWALGRLPAGAVHAFLPGLVQLRRVSNTGAAWSLFSGNPQVLGWISLLVSLGLLLWILRTPPTDRWQALALGFLLGGAAGNGLDRWRLGAVVDFLEFMPISFPIFNIADIAINLAVACFAIHLLAPQRRSRGSSNP
ncbi:MAG: signal peptidase II [Cyanobacteria bacterium]|nr:signal peptidase II [Cyanobacteriota bacterium]